MQVTTYAVTVMSRTASVNTWPCLSRYIALNFTADWAQASLKANTTYKSFSSAVVNADVGLHVGLYGINITLKGEETLIIYSTSQKFGHTFSFFEKCFLYFCYFLHGR